MTKITETILDCRAYLPARGSGKVLLRAIKRIKEQEDAAMLSKNAKIKKSVAAYYKYRYYIYYRYIINYKKGLKER